METLGKVQTLEEITRDFEAGTTYGSIALDNGDAYAWAQEKPRSWVFDLPDMKRQLEVDTTQLAQWIDEPERNQTLTDIKGGVKSLGTTVKNTFAGFNLLGLKYTSPSMSDTEAKTLFNIVGRSLTAMRESQQSLLQSEGINPESFAFGATNAIGQAVMTAVAGLATGGMALPIAIGVGQTLGTKEAEYATTYAERGGDLTQQPKKDDWIALGLGAVEGFLDRAVGAERLFSKVAKKGLIKQIVKATGGEALEEGLQEPIEYLGNTVAGYEDRTYWELAKDTLNSAIFGTISGGTMGTGMYMVHRSKIQKVYEDMGFTPEEAKEKAIETIDTGKIAVIQEMKSRSELINHYGEEYNRLEDKIRTLYENAGRENIKENITDEEFNKFVELETRSFTNKILNFANIKGISTKEVLDIADIEQYGNTLRLNTPDMKSELDLRRKIADKKEKATKLKAELEAKKAKKLGVEGKTNEETSINLKIKKLEDQIAKTTSDIELKDKSEQVKALREQISQIQAEKKGIEADTARETNLNLQINALEKRLERILENKDITDKKRVKAGLEKAKTTAEKALKDASKLKVGITAKNFTDTMTKAELKKVTLSDGSIDNIAVQRRYNDAVLAKIINNPAKFERLILSGVITPEIQDKIVRNANVIENFNQNYAEYGLNDDLREALSILEDTNEANFAEQIVNSEKINTFNGSVFAYVLLKSDDKARFDTFIAEYTDNIEIYKAKGDPLSIKNDVLGYTLRGSQIANDKFDANGVTNDKDILAIYSNINNFMPDNLIPDISMISPKVAKEAKFIKDAIDSVFKAKQTNKGKSLSTFVRGLGGIYDSQGELASRDIKSDIAKKSRVNKNGKKYLEMEYVIQAAFDNGYFPQAETWEDVSIDDFVTALEQDYFTTDKILPFADAQERAVVRENLRNIDFYSYEMGINQNDTLEEIEQKLQQYYIDRGDVLFQTDIKTETPEGYIRLYRGLEQKFRKDYDLTSTDAPQGYSTWTDNPELARQYAGEKGYVYYVDLPLNELGKEIVDKDGERPLFIDNEKKAGLNNISGKEYLIYTHHDNYDVNNIKEYQPNVLKTETPEFKAWFGDSKVVDADGKPLVVYHGSMSKFDAFDITKAGQASSVSKVGFWFSPQKDFAENFVKDIWYGKDGETVYPVYLSMKNPKIYETTGDSRNDDAYAKFKIDIYEIDGQPAENATVGGLGMVLNSQSSVGKFRDKLKQEGYDGIIIKNTRYDEEIAGGNNDQYVVFDPTQIKSVNNRGTFDPNDPNIYNQRKRVNASYNINTKEIILGKRFNSMSLQHEMAHFWLDYMFNDVKAWREGAELTDLYRIELGNLFEFLNVKDKQTSLTRDQQELFATLTEQYLTHRTALPQGTEFAVGDYLNYVPSAYNTFRDFGYRDANGKIQNPIMTPDVKDWFDRFFTNWGISTTYSPKITELYVPQVEPKEPEVQARANNIEQEAKAEKAYTDKVVKEVIENRTIEEKQGVATKGRDYEQEAKDILLPPELPVEEKQGLWTMLREGRGTNNRQEMSKEAVKWVAKNPDKALEIALGSSLESDVEFVPNTSPVDRGTLIRAVQANESIIKGDKTLKEKLGMQFAFSRSLAGKESGLSNDISNRLFLDGLGKAQRNFMNKYLVKRYGNKADAQEIYDRELTKFVKEFAPRIYKAKNNQEIASEISNMIRQSEALFGKADKSDMLFQSELPKNMLKDRDKFIEYAKKLIKKHNGSLPTADYEYNLYTLATRAQLALPDLNSMDEFKYLAAADELRAYQDYLIKTEIPLTIMDKIIGGFASRSMLSGVSTHVKNLVSNTLEIPIVKTALTAKYGKSEVSKDLIKTYADKMTKIYEKSLISIPQMHTLNDRALIAGEIYRIEDAGNVTIGGVKIGTLGQTKIPDPLALLGRSDFYFRRIAYLQTLAHIATHKSKQSGETRTANEIFKELNTLDASNPSDERLEAILVSNISVFTQNGELSRWIGSLRNSLDEYTAPLLMANRHGLGTLVATFVKTPSNILQLGAEALASPFSIVKSKIKGQELSVKQYIDVAHLVSAVTIAGAMLVAGCDYEPPYKVGNRYDKSKHYDSIKIGNIWVQLDSLGVLSTPVRLMLGAKDQKTWEKTAEGTLGQLPIDFGGLRYAITQPKKGLPYFVESQLAKGIPAATSIARPFIRETGLKMPTYDKIGSQFARRLGLDGKDTTINDYIHILASFISVDEE